MIGGGFASKDALAAAGAGAMGGAGGAGPGGVGHKDAGIVGGIDGGGLGNGLGVHDAPGAPKMVIAGLADEDSDSAPLMQPLTKADGTEYTWQPKLRKTQALGKPSREVRNHFCWPKKHDIDDLPCEKSIKLNGFGFKATSLLYQLKFRFTNGVESGTFNALSSASEDPKIIDINTEKEIAAVEVNMISDEGSIYGLRFLD